MALSDWPGKEDKMVTTVSIQDFQEFKLMEGEAVSLTFDASNFGTGAAG